MTKPSKFEDSGSGKKAKVIKIDKTETQDANPVLKEVKPEEINIMSLFHLIQETAKEQRDNIRRIEDNLDRNNELLKEQNAKLSKDMESVVEDVNNHDKEIQVLKVEVQTLKENVDPVRTMNMEEETKSARCLAERNANEVDETKTKMEELQNEMEKLGRMNMELKSEIQEIKNKGKETSSIQQESWNSSMEHTRIDKLKLEMEKVSKINEELRTDIMDIKSRTARTPSNPQEPIQGNSRTGNKSSQEEPTSRPPTSTEQTDNPTKKSYAQILLEEKSKRFKAAYEPQRKQTPVFITSDKTAEELFNEAKHYVGIENVNCHEIRKYLWHGEAGDENSETSDLVSDQQLMYADRYKEERINAATGILTDRFGFYLNEVQIEDAWFCNLRGPNSIYISSGNKYFIRSIYWKAAAARDRTYRVSPWIPLAANDRKMEIEKRLAKIRKTQVNLRTQVRIGNDDFDVLGKISNTGRAERFEIIHKEKYDPNNDLPKIRCKENSSNDAAEETIRQASDRLNDAANQTAVVPEGWTPARNKRKERSPRQEDGLKKVRKFSPNQAGKSIVRQIKNRGMKTDESTETSSTESDSDESVLEETALPTNGEERASASASASARAASNTSQ